MTATRTVPRHVTPSEVRDWALQDARERTEELVTLLQVPGPHLTNQTLSEAMDAWERIGSALERLTEAQDRLTLCERRGTCPTYTPATRRAAQEAIEQREAMRGMTRDIGPSSYETGAWGEMLP